MSDTAQDAAKEFIAKWRGVSASELSTAQSFAIDLCELLGVPRPDADQSYMFDCHGSPRWVRY